MQLFTVGGAIRDLLAGRAPQDHDVIFSGSTEEFIRAYPQARKAGQAFPICILKGLEYAPLRGDTVEEDLQARDFTINAIAADAYGKLTAHPDAFADLQNGILRPASPQAMEQDAGRVFRAARFLAQYSWLHPHEETIRQMRQAGTSGKLKTISSERVAAELEKALTGELPGEFFRLLQHTGCLDFWFTPFGSASAISAGPPPYHSETVLEHTCMVMDRVAGMAFSRPLVQALGVWMACCHDLGKTVSPKNALPRHYGHDVAGEQIAETQGRKLKLPNRYIRAGALAARWHMHGAQYTTLRPAKRVDLLTALGSDALLESFFALVTADSGNSYLTQAQEELALIRQISLPEKWRNRGPESGIHLRQLRSAALAACRSDN